VQAKKAKAAKPKVSPQPQATAKADGFKIEPQGIQYLILEKKMMLNPMMRGKWRWRVFLLAPEHSGQSKSKLLLWHK
jgi:hypothetical protein